MTLEAKVQNFLAQKRIAVAGVSRDNSHYPVRNLIYHRLKNTGHDVFLVNPNLQTFEGDPCYPDVSRRRWSGGQHATETTEQIVRECGEAGIRRVWMHESLPKGSSVSSKGVEYC